MLRHVRVGHVTRQRTTRRQPPPLILAIRHWHQPCMMSLRQPGSGTNSATSSPASLNPLSLQDGARSHPPGGHSHAHSPRLARSGRGSEVASRGEISLPRPLPLPLRRISLRVTPSCLLAYQHYCADSDRHSLRVSPRSRISRAAAAGVLPVCPALASSFGPANRLPVVLSLSLSLTKSHSHSQGRSNPESRRIARRTMNSGVATSCGKTPAGQ
jgi:hypothetical protein